MARIFDSHAHYDGERFDEDRDALLSSLSSYGIDAVINIGSALPSSLASVELDHRYDFIFAAVGVHPHDAAGCEAGYLDKLAALSRDPKVVAIGEIGLDYHYDFSPRDVQRRVFEEQLILARDLDLPVVIHMREATQDALDLLGRYRPRGVVHCFSSSRETAKTILSFGMYIGYTGDVYKRQYLSFSIKILDVVEGITGRKIPACPLPDIVSAKFIGQIGKLIGRLPAPLIGDCNLVNIEKIYRSRIG